MKNKLDFRIMMKSGILLVALIFPLSYVHEFGHASVCAFEGYDYQITVDALGGSMLCIGNVENEIMFKMMGGTLAMFVVFLPFLRWNWCKNHPYILIPCLVLGIGHGFNAIIETAMPDLYFSEHEILSSVMGLFQFVIFLLFMMKFGKKSYGLADARFQT